MAEVPITINGVICDLYGRTITGPVKIVGSLVRTDLSVGGGPIIPPDSGGGGGNPPGIWGGSNEPFPTPPIANVPGIPNPNPPGWGEGPPDGPPPDTGGGEDPGSIVKAPPVGGGWAYSPEFGWGYFPMGGVGPKR